MGEQFPYVDQMVKKIVENSSQKTPSGFPEGVMNFKLA
jgi:hypothetical protein